MCCFCDICRCFKSKKKDNKSGLKSKSKISERRLLSRVRRKAGQPLEQRTDSPSTKRISQISNEELLKPISLPTDGFSDPFKYLKSKGFDVLLSKKLGSGQYGIVYKALKVEYLANNKKNEIPIAVKIIESTADMNVNKRDKHMMTMRRELYVLERLKNDYIIETIKCFVIEYETKSLSKVTNAFIFMEYATEGDLEQEVRREGPFSNQDSKRYFAQIAQGIKYMHRLGIAHRDLKLDNVLLVMSEHESGFKDCKISDFGLSELTYFEDQGYTRESTYKGTRYYMAPEIIRVKLFGHKLTEKQLEYEPMPTDCWALGVIAYRLLTKEFPFVAEKNTLEKTLRDQENKNYTFPAHMQELAKELIRRCFEPEFHKRIDSDLIVSHRWLESETSLTATVMDNK